MYSFGRDDSEFENVLLMFLLVMSLINLFKKNWVLRGVFVMSLKM